jgi:probable rRNA maturation factor
MSGDLSLRNRQRARRLDLRLLRRVIAGLLADLEAKDFDLTIHLIGEREMAQLNESRLGHPGSTDVITFDYGEPNAPMAGEIFVCVDDALAQASRFRTAWQEELVRYIVHGILHLRGHDDLRPIARRLMKREEGRLLKKLSRDFRLSKLSRKPKVSA